MTATGAVAGVPAAAAAAPAPGNTDLEEIIVTGSRIEQRLEDAPVAVIVIDNDALQRSSKDAIGKVLQQIPINTGFSQNTNVNNGGDGTSRVNLRGLGSERTVVLVNGRRLVYGGNGGATSVDVNMIPMSIVDRVEMMGVGSSTVYGADAIGGVVNLITRKDFNGAEINGSYTTSDHSDGTIYDVQFVAGQANEKGYFTFGAELVDQHAVYQGARAYSRQTLFLTDTGDFEHGGNPVTGDGQFRVPAVNALGLGRGVYTRVAGSPNPPTAEGFRLFETPADLYDPAPVSYLQTPSMREYVWAIAGYDLSDRVSLFIDALVHHRDSEHQVLPTPFNSFDPIGGAPLRPSDDPAAAQVPYIPADNYYNPFGVDLIGSASPVRRRFVETGSRHFSEDARTQWYVAGLRGDIGDSTWNWELSADYGRNETDVTSDGQFLTDRMQLALGPSGPDAAGNIVCGKRDLASGIVPADSIIAGCVPLNVFGGAGTITRAMLDYVTGTFTDRGYNEQQAYELIFRGDWGTLPGGDVRWATGITHRVESAASRLDEAKLGGVANQVELNLSGNGNFKADEAYVEAVAPLVKDRTAVKEFNFTAGLRYSDFSSFGSVTTYQGGMMYRPIRPITVRASYGTVFRAPPVAALYEADMFVDAGIRDPCGHDPDPDVAANCAAAGVPGGSYVQDDDKAVPGVQGGNPGLQPEQGHSVSAGLTLVPGNPAGVQVSVDYWLTRLDDVIVLYPAYEEYPEDCAYFGAKEACDRVARHPDGSIRLIDLRHQNAASLTSSGYDFDLGYVASMGDGSVSARASTTYMSELTYRPVKGVPPYNAAGQDFQFGAAPRLRGLGYVEYSRHGWSASYEAQYIGHMKEYVDYRGALPANQYLGWHKIEARWYQDVRLQYAMDNGPTFALAVNNLADEDPPFVVYGSGANTDQGAYPLLGRTYYASLSYRIE